jgi:hypothetical protein
MLLLPRLVIHGFSSVQRYTSMSDGILLEVNSLVVW